MLNDLGVCGEEVSENRVQEEALEKKAYSHIPLHSIYIYINREARQEDL